MIKNKHLIFLIFLFLFLGLSTSYVLALEVSYPDIPFLPDIDDSTEMGDYIGYLFGFGIYLVGIISLISFAIGATRLIGAGATGNPGGTGDAKDQMKGAILGLILTLSSFLIIQTINPQLIGRELPPLDPLSPGVFYSNGSEQMPAPRTENDVANRSEVIIKGEFNSLAYNCRADGKPSPALLVWLYPNPGFAEENSNYEGVTVVRLECGDNLVEIGDSGSFKYTFETPGIYYCMDGCGSAGMCSGFMSGGYTRSQRKISSPFFKNIKAIRIVNNAEGGTYFGAIFHEKINFDSLGSCSLPLINKGSGSICKEVNIPAASVDIFRWKKDIAESKTTGVVFYSKPFGTTETAKALRATASNTMIKNSPNQPYYIPACTLNFLKFNKVDEPHNRMTAKQTRCTPSSCSNSSSSSSNRDDDCSDDACETFADKNCYGSLYLQGNYLVAIYSTKSSGSTNIIDSISSSSELYCRTITKDIDNILATAIIETGFTMENIYIIPKK